MIEQMDARWRKTRDREKMDQGLIRCLMKGMNVTGVMTLDLQSHPSCAKIFGNSNVGDDIRACYTDSSVYCLLHDHVCPFINDYRLRLLSVMNFQQTPRPSCNIQNFLSTISNIFLEGKFSNLEGDKPYRANPNQCNHQLEQNTIRYMSLTCG